MSARGIERLRTLYAVMAGVPSKGVNLFGWRSKSNMDDSQLLKVKEIDCGTTACAVGWACAYPKFKKAGLRFDGTTPEFNGEYNWHAVCAFFGFENFVAAEAVFSSGTPDTLEQSQIRKGERDALLNDKQRVMRRIRRHLLVEGVITPARNAELAAQEGVPL